MRELAMTCLYQSFLLKKDIKQVVYENTKDIQPEWTQTESPRKTYLKIPDSVQDDQTPASASAHPPEADALSN